IINIFNLLKPHLRTLTHEQREIVLNRVKSSFQDVILPKLMMNWDDLRTIKNKGNYVGSHSVSHSMLATVSDEEIIRHEVLHSAKRINDELGYFPISFSYPLGNYDERTISILKESGYKMGLAVKQNVFNPLKDNVFSVPRIELYNESWWKTKLRISNRLEELKYWIGYKNKS
ncbi:MAG: polysaccharide deacetylase family protein, partial [Cytophagales bacterium]